MVSLRPAKQEDFDFLWRLHCSAMKPYVEATWGWDDEWQHNHFREHFDAQKLQIIVFDAEDIGVLSLEAKDGGTFLANMSIRPEYQRKGIGTTVIQRVLDESTEKKQPVSLQVLKVNPAKELYSRLGFRLVGETETHFLMTRDPFPLSDNLHSADNELIEAAGEVLCRNYYAERHTVAAAVRCLSGQIHTGINIESCGYGPCAEPIAIGAAFTNGERGLSAIVAVCTNRIGKSCGA